VAGQHDQWLSTLAEGSECEAEFEEDGIWYFAQVLQVIDESRQWLILFPDYGNTQLCEVHQLRPVDNVYPERAQPPEALVEEAPPSASPRPASPPSVTPSPTSAFTSLPAAAPATPAAAPAVAAASSPTSVSPSPAQAAAPVDKSPRGATPASGMVVVTLFPAAPFAQLCACLATAVQQQKPPASSRSSQPAEQPRASSFFGSMFGAVASVIGVRKCCELCCLRLSLCL
jgi:hypothetical protein